MTKGRHDERVVILVNGPVTHDPLSFAEGDRENTGLFVLTATGCKNKSCQPSAVCKETNDFLATSVVGDASYADLTALRRFSGFLVDCPV